MRELICRIVGPDAQVVDAFNQIKARMVHMTAIQLGQPGERTSYARLEDPDTGALIEMMHVDEFGIARTGEYLAPNPYPVWIQPTGGHDAYPVTTLKGEPVRVMHAGDVWENTAEALNSWEPGTAGWTKISGEEPPVEPPANSYPAWQPWSGHNADLYQIGNRVTHVGKTWEATAGNNHWEPGVFGWVEVQA